MKYYAILTEYNNGNLYTYFIEAENQESAIIRLRNLKLGIGKILMISELESEKLFKYFN